MSGDDHLERYRIAIAENFPELKITTIEYLAEGWDSVACRVNRRWIFRFPKRAAAAEALKIELNLLPGLLPLLPCAIPDFRYIADPPGQSYPHLFSGYEMIPGMAQPDWPEEVAGAEWWPPQVGEFLTALHSFPVEQARRLGVPDKLLTGVNQPAATWRVTLLEFYGLVRRLVFPVLGADQQAGVARRFETFLGDGRNFEFRPVLLHGDLWDDHILLDPARRKLTGVIDFGGVGIGDPAIDVARRVRPYYGGELDQTYEQRRRFYARLQPLFAIVFGLQHDDLALVEYGRYGVDDEKDYLL